MTDGSLLVVTPTYNERDNLPEFLQRLWAAQPRAQVLVVDDNSPDGTGLYARQRALSEFRLHVLQRPAKLGIGSAYLDAMRWALARPSFQTLVQMDTDLSHDAAELDALLAAVQAGADLVLGSRNIPGGGVSGWGPWRHTLSRGGSLYSRWILGLPLHDLTSGYKVFTRRALEAIDLSRVQSEGYAFQIEMTYRAHRAGLSIEEVPIRFVDRRAGESKMSPAIIAEAVAVAWKLRFASRKGEV